MGYVFNKEIDSLLGASSILFYNEWRVCQMDRMAGLGDTHGKSKVDFRRGASKGMLNCYMKDNYSSVNRHNIHICF